MTLFFFLSLFFFLLFLVLEIFLFFIQKKNKLILERNQKENPNIAILIPARNESKVIEELLESIEKQTWKIDVSSIYIIVESLEDETVEIAKRHHMNYFVRKKLHLKTKGYALAEMIEDLARKNLWYDCYFIFDADNVLEKNFIENMMGDYQKGYAVSTGYRKIKNRDHFLPCSAGLTFYLVNEVHNERMEKNHGNLILSGTGYYIHGRLIKEWETFPFHSLTEDYESSLYYALHGISTHYRKDACFLDEQPRTYKQSITQRSRWIKGYFLNFFHYQKSFFKKIKERPSNLGSLVEMQMGILPIIFLILAVIFLLFEVFIQKKFLIFIGILLFVYCFLVLLTYGLLKKAKKYTTISKKLFFQTLFYHPIFLLSYVHAFVVSFKKNLGWNVVEHGKN